MQVDVAYDKFMTRAETICEDVSTLNINKFSVTYQLAVCIHREIAANLLHNNQFPYIQLGKRNILLAYIT